MPSDLELDEPSAVDPALPNPAFDESNYKTISEKFKTLWNPKPNAEPTPDASPKPAEPASAAPKLDPKPAPAVEPDEVKEPGPTEPVTREHFKRLNQSREAYKTEAKRAKDEATAAALRVKQLEEDLTKTKASLPPNLEEVQKAIADARRVAEENKRLTETLETINLEKSPKFQRWWKTETDKHVKVAQQHVPAAHREAVAKLLMETPSSERDAALDEILEPLSATAKRLATGALEAIESLRVQRDDLLTNGSERYKELQAAEASQRDKEAKAQQDKHATLTLEALQRAKLYTAFQPNGDATHDAEIPQREAFVRAAMSGKVDRDIALSMPAISVEYLHLKENVIPGMQAEMAKQSALIKQLQGGSVRASDGKGGSAPKEDSNTGNSFAERVKQAMTQR